MLADSCIHGVACHYTPSAHRQYLAFGTPEIVAAELGTDQVNSLVTGLSKSIIRVLEADPKHEDNPDIFWYQLLIDKTKGRLLCRMAFYGGFDVFAVSDPRLSGESV